MKRRTRLPAGIAMENRARESSAMDEASGSDARANKRWGMTRRLWHALRPAMLIVLLLLMTAGLLAVQWRSSSSGGAEGQSHPALPETMMPRFGESSSNDFPAVGQRLTS